MYWKQTDTTRPHTTLPLKFDTMFFVPPPALFGDHNNGEQLHNWAKQRISKLYKITPVQKRALELLKQSKITFSVEIVVEQDKLIFHPKAAAPPIFRVKLTHHPLFFKKYTISSVDTQRTQQAILSAIIHTLDFLTHVHYKSNSHLI